MNKEAENVEKPFGNSGIPQHLRANPEVDEPGGVNAQQVSVALASHPTAENIIWTDPDAIDKNIPELQKLLAGPKRDVWMKSETEAKRAAIREGKCVLIWFTDSARSPICKTLSAELFGQADFGDWARENTVRLIVDQSALMARGEKYDNEVSAQQYVEEMKKKYKALGAPTVVMLSPKGEMLAKFRGYKKGQAEFFWGQLKQSANVGKEEYQVWMSKLEKQGYRRWESKQGLPVVARLVSYHKGELLMVEPDGNRFRTKESSLSRADQDWIAAEKKKRGIE
jgi:thioredoxin-related protein